MTTAEHLLSGKGLCESVPVQFPAGTLEPPFELKTEGTIYKAAPVGTMTLSVAQPPNGFEYFFAKSLGDVFTPVPQKVSEKVK